MPITTIPNDSRYLNKRGTWFALVHNEHGPSESVIASNSLAGLQRKAERARKSGLLIGTHAHKVLSDDHSEKYFNVI